jgi:hypothetical protein
MTRANGRSAAKTDNGNSRGGRSGRFEFESRYDSSRIGKRSSENLNNSTAKSFLICVLICRWSVLTPLITTYVIS